MPVEFDGLSVAKAPEIIGGFAASQQKAPDRSGAFRGSGVYFKATSAPRTA
jgi:hypothetical protein